jgi:homoserine kinase type II
MLVKWSIATGRFPRLAALADLVAWLHRQELPVSAPVAARDGRHQVEIDGVSMCLQREVAGDLLDVTDPDQLDDGGMVLARLHTALVSYPSAQRIPGLSAPSEPLAAQIVDWLDSSAAHVPAAACRTLRRLVTEVSSEQLPVQLIHGDFRSANIICAGQQVVAVLDFEEARLGHRVVDLARSAVLIGTRFHDWGPVTPEVRAGLLDGYQSVCRLTRIEIAWWDALVLWFSLTMIPDGADPTGWRSAATVVSDNCRRTP